MYTAHVACAIKIAEYRRIDKTTECQKVSIHPKRGRNRHAVGIVSFVNDLGLYLFFLISWIICGPAVTAPMSAGCVNTLSRCGKAVIVCHWPSRRSGRAASSVLASRRSLQCVYTLVVWMSVWPMMAVRSSSLAPAAASSVASQCRAL